MSADVASHVPDGAVLQLQLLLPLDAHHELAVALLLVVEALLGAELRLPELLLQHEHPGLQGGVVLLGAGVALVRAGLVVGQHTDLLLQHLDLQQERATR